MPATLAGPLVPFPVGFYPNWVFSQSIEAKCIVLGLSGFGESEVGGSARAWPYFPSKGVKGKKNNTKPKEGVKIKQ